MADLEIVELAKKAQSKTGVHTDYVGADGIRYLGGFYNIPGFENLIVIVQKDQQFAYNSIRQSLKKSALYGGLFFMIAILFSFWGATGVTRSLRELTTATQKVAGGEFDIQVQVRSNDEVGFLSRSINEMAKKIQNLLHIEVQAARTQQELETAKMVQSSFFPRKPLNDGKLHVSGFYQPATECGGDLWGYFKVNDHVTAIFIADAMGHGVPAALVTAIAYSTYKSIEDMLMQSQEKDASPGDILGRVNRIIHEALSGKIHMTCFLALIDTAAGKMSYANAGHNFPVLSPFSPNDSRAAKSPSYLKKISDRKVTSLNKLNGLPLGNAPETKYEDAVINLEAGDRMVFYTDGIIEGLDPNGTQFGKKSFYQSILRSIGEEPEKWRNNILTEAYSYYQQRMQDDYITLVVIDVNKDLVFSRSSDNASLKSSAVGSKNINNEQVPAILLDFEEDTLSVQLPPPPANKVG